MAPKKSIVFSGIQPTGTFTLGNYIGAVRNWDRMQQEYNCIYCIVDLHALTIRQDPAAFRERILASYALTMACGIDPERSVLFIQSHNPHHAQGAWVLDCYTQFGELSRMTQFKDKSAQHTDNINAGLFTYPSLMAADILLYQTDEVPVGDDQKQHIELTRDIATRFNGLYGNTFVVPKGVIPQSSQGGRIMSLQDPLKKMSKSDPNPKACISILDPEATILKKFRSAVTDSEARVAYGPGKEGINNLMVIYSVFTGRTMEEIEDEFAGRGYGDFKTAVGQSVADALAPIQEKYHRLMADRGYLEQCYRTGAQRAMAISGKTLDKMHKKLGLIL